MIPATEQRLWSICRVLCFRFPLCNPFLLKRESDAVMTEGHLSEYHIHLYKIWIYVHEKASWARQAIGLVQAVLISFSSLCSIFCVVIIVFFWTENLININIYIYDNQSTHLNATLGNKLEFHLSVIDKNKSQGKSFHNTELWNVNFPIVMLMLVIPHWQESEKCSYKKKFLCLNSSTGFLWILLRVITLPNCKKMERD